MPGQDRSARNEEVLIASEKVSGYSIYEKKCAINFPFTSHSRRDRDG
jgi:hypothetical protein